MPGIIRKYDNRNQPIVTQDTDPLSLIYFNLVKLDADQVYEAQVDGFETLYVVLSGNCRITVAKKHFSNIGQRSNIWSGKADSVYAPVNAQVAIKANRDHTEIAVAGGLTQASFEPFRVTPDEVDMVDVGTNSTKSRRRIFHLLGQNAVGRAGNLLVSELYADEGCWSGYPPHKHDEERGDDESDFEELYHYRFQPETGFGAQLTFQPDGSSEAFLTRSGDTFLLDRGYHPTVTSPGHEAYIFTIIVGRHRRSLLQHFSEEYDYLMERIPGISTMRAKFK